MKFVFFVVIFLNLLLGVFILNHNSKSTNNRLYFVISICAALWTFTRYMITIFPTIFWLQSTYAFGSLVMSMGLVWVLFLSEKKLKIITTSIIIFISLFFFFGSYYNGFIITTKSHVGQGATFIGEPGWGLVLYTLYYIILSTVIVWRLYKYQNVAFNLEKKYQLRYILGGSLFTLLTSGLSSFILPLFSVFLFGWIDSFGFLIFLISVAYSITRHKLFDIKIVAIELGILILWITILLRIGISIDTREILLESILFIISVILGIILIRTSLREAHQREELADLNLHLAQKVEEQTKEVKKAYELEKKAKRDLEKLNETKDQFIMITQHNLRTPVTTIRWELESILSGSEGAVDESVRKTLLDTQDSVNSLGRIVDDFLNITSLKVGSQILNLERSSLLPLLENVIKELRIDIENQNINISYPESPEDWPELKIDVSKIREVIMIVIENAIKYNFPNGNIEIQTRQNNHQFELTIKNTGVGIAQEEKQNLFERLFYRGKKAQATHPSGMGIGLSVSKAIINAHHGDISINSDGENQGATVKITLPY